MFIILTAFTLLGLLYDFTVPLFEKPDELKHFAVIQYIQTQHRLPVVKAGAYRLWDQEGVQPPLYHLLAALATAWLDLSDFEEPPRNPHYVDERSFIWRERGNNNLYLHPVGENLSLQPILVAARLARWLSLLAGLGTVALTYVLARLIFPVSPSHDLAAPPISHPFALLAATFIAFIPQFLHTSTAITNDSLSTTIAAAVLALLAFVIKYGCSTRSAIYLGLALGLGAITKLSLLYLLPLTGLVLLIDFFRFHPDGTWRSISRLLRFGLIIAGLILLVAGWWYARNWSVYGDVTALNAHLLYRGGPLNPTPGLAQIWQTELTGLELSFWAAFGAGQILLEPWLYTILRSVKYLIFAGLIIGFWRRVRKQISNPKSQSTLHASPPTSHAPDPTYLIILAILGLWSLIIFIALLRWMQITPASWGRLLYPTLPALAVLTAWSLSQFNLPTLSGSADRSSHSTRYVLRPTPYALHPMSPPFPAIPLILAIFLFTLSLISPWRYLQTAYAKTPLISEVEVPFETIERLDFVYDGALRLMGYRVEKSPVQPGQWLPVTLYWQATQPVTKNYTVFVHLLGPDNQVIGQANTYPDGGNRPAAWLEPGKVLEDIYAVPTAPDAKAPAVIRLGLGIFEFEDPARTAKVALNSAGEVVEPIVGAIPLIPYQWPKLNPAQILVANFAGQIKLIGYDWVNNQEIKSGAQVLITFYWETLAAPAQNLNLFIHLVDPATETQAAGFDGPPDYPTLYWQPGNTFIDTRQLSLPSDLPPGDYELRIGWYNLETLARLPLATESGTTQVLRLFRIKVKP